MVIGPGLSIGAGSLSIKPPTHAADVPGESFGQIVTGALNTVHTSQVQADNAVQQFVTGGTADVHEVMLAMEQSRMTMTLAVEVRNKVVEAYQEISRMPV